MTFSSKHAVSRKQKPINPTGLAHPLVPAPALWFSAHLVAQKHLGWENPVRGTRGSFDPSLARRLFAFPSFQPTNFPFLTKYCASGSLQGWRRAFQGLVAILANAMHRPGSSAIESRIRSPIAERIYRVSATPKKSFALASLSPVSPWINGGVGHPQRHPAALREMSR